MSLVERALKKIQESRANAAPQLQSGEEPAPVTPTARVQPSGLTVGLAHVAPSELAAPIAPARTVHVDREALRQAQVLPSPQQERLLADEYRHIKRPLIANAMGKGSSPVPNGHLIMMASALPGDGKTFTSVNLALSIALEKDISVLLIDADVAKPHITELFKLSGELGLLDVLTDETLNVETVVMPTDVPGLSILPAGKYSNMATELLASTRMEQILAQLIARDPNRVVLLDSPPLLLTSESRVLASIAGQIVLVVRAGVTPQHVVLDTIDLLDEDKFVGLVLNQSNKSGRSDYYDYYGQYGKYPDPTNDVT